MEGGLLVLVVVAAEVRELVLFAGAGLPRLQEELLRVRTDLRAGPGRHQLFNFLPIFSKETQAWTRMEGTFEELQVLLLGPPAVGSGCAIRQILHF